MPYFARLLLTLNLNVSEQLENMSMIGTSLDRDTVGQFHIHVHLDWGLTESLDKVELANRPLQDEGRAETSGDAAGNGSSTATQSSYSCRIGRSL